MLDRELARKLMEVENLPTLPAVMQQLLAAVENEASSAADITSILERDIAISARILRLANSAFYGLRHKVDTIRRAVVVVGFDVVRMLALATSVFDLFSQRQQYALDPEDFWLHSLGAAKASQLLAREIPGAQPSDSCFTAGLLHDMGKYFLALALKDTYKDVLEMAERSQCLLCEIEKDALAITHCEVAYWLAQKWSLPPVIADAIGNQCRVGDYDGPFWREVSIVSLASDVARHARFGKAGDFSPVTLRGEPLARLALNADLVLGIVDQLSEYHGEAKHFLNALRGR
ncbi:MAG TPA: HDOD domain-containing protein [Candidatus Hydrogenedentes bacterium]|nr:HDOD domain-containing protein [Candidatus Hydrogenedentota bacterium]